ncbi:right-handed parallel beta-helix repeat-containing protein [Methanosarcina barkeri]|uniref:Chitin binding protein n=3 Tax=Methanosarcina TaxID=2207 RepID=A0A0E3LNP1_METBA|nr:PKD domain-containing protein [Methanosarcina barkeri]AKB55111.1 Chitin binding protein [Methanosarcina barkeri MS]AKB56810.1 Chitin binding protein [Methanosarcina barkeri 227]
MKINKKIGLISIVLILCLIIVSSTASAATINVGPNEKYKTIQKAVDAAHKGDTIIVNSGTYPENVHITKDNLTILGKGYPKVSGFYNAEESNDDFGREYININGFSITKNGIDLVGRATRGQIIKNNYFYSCGVSFDGDMASGTIESNYFTNGGISLSQAGVNIIGNEIKNADIGIGLYQGAGSATYASISKNKITGCNVGIEFYHESSSPGIYNNYFSNKNNIIFDSSWNGAVSWNTTKTAGSNIVSGPYIAGNFWGSPDGKGFSQTASDNDSDGIADSPYVLNSKNIDYLPLVAIKTPVKTPVASFKTSKSSGKAPLTVKFTDTSTGTPTKWKWDFGDGSKSYHQNPVHKYSKAGVYTVSLTAKNAHGSNTVTKTDYVKVIAKPVAVFSASPTSGKTPLKVQFTDTSTGTPTSWFWKFGDGSKSYLQNPTHKYSKAGTYTVSLIVKNAAGRNSVTKTKYIKVVTKPVAAFSASPTSGKTPLKVKFTDTSTGTPTAWKWDFGDGSKSYHQNPVHKYSKAGTYTVSLTVKNAAGRNSVTKTKYITVTGTSQAPTADFWGWPLSGKAPLKVTFTETSKGSPTSWKWDFGDGKYSTEKSPTHTYSSAGIYTVKLTATNAAGSSTKLKWKYIKVAK